jgi:predicted dehydrogenase
MIGCGAIANSHLAAYAKIEGVKIVAFCDVNRAAAETASGQYGGGDVTTDLHEVLARDDVEAVDVCLHNNFHMSATVAGLRAGKHVYCEKPMAGSYRDAVTMRDVANETGKMLHIQLATLYGNETHAAKELIDEGALGEVFHARSTGFRRRGRPYVDGYGTASFVQKKHASGGALYDMGVYHIAQILHLLGNPIVERVSGKTYQKLAMDEARRSISNYDVEELAAGFVRLEGDRSMEIIESWAANLDPFEGSFLLGSKGGIRLYPFGFFENRGDLELKSTVDLGSFGYRRDTVLGIGPYYSSSQHHWVAALRGDVPLWPTAELALNTMLISEGIYLSQARNCEVSAEEVAEASVSTAIQL